MNAVNRRAGMRDVYAIHLNMAKAKGLWMHMPFTLCGNWGKYGQWGHLEHSSQNPGAAPKYQFMLDWISEAAALRRYAPMTSADGYTAGAELFTSERDNGAADQFYAFTLPDTAVYRALSGPTGFRIYGFSGQYGGHKTSLISFKITADSPYPVRPDAVDADGDGMADAWELAYFAATNAAEGGASHDFDGDGVANLAEYLAGTNPTNEASVLRLDEAASLPPDTLQLGWSSVSGALYRLEGRDTLTGEVPWSAVSDTVTATPPLNVHTTTVHGTQGFYRIRLEAVP